MNPNLCCKEIVNCMAADTDIAYSSSLRVCPDGALEVYDGEYGEWYRAHSADSDAIDLSPIKFCPWCGERFKAVKVPD